MKTDKARARERQQNYRRKVEKLQRAGLLGKINLRRKRDPKAVKAIIKYADVLSGKSVAVKAPSAAIARKVKADAGLKGKGATVIVPKEGKERNIKITAAGEITSTRINPATGEKLVVKKGRGAARPPKPGEKVYYTIRERRRGLGTIKRTTFNKFDDLLEYLNAYDLNFEDVEPFFETETLSEYGRKARRYEKTISEERAEGHRRWARRRRRRDRQGPFRGNRKR